MSEYGSFIREAIENAENRHGVNLDSQHINKRLKRSFLNEVNATAAEEANEKTLLIHCFTRCSEIRNKILIYLNEIDLIQLLNVSRKFKSEVEEFMVNRKSLKINNEVMHKLQLLSNLSPKITLLNVDLPENEKFSNLIASSFQLQLPKIEELRLHVGGCNEMQLIQCPHLKRLTLKLNCSSVCTCKPVAEFLSSLNSLKHLKIENPSFEVCDDFKSIPTLLKSLDLSCGSYGNDMYEMFIDSCILNQLTNLQSFSINNEDDLEDDVCELLNQLSDLQNLKCIKLRLKCKYPLEHLIVENLEELSLFGKMIEGDSKDFRLKNLKKLSLDVEEMSEESLINFLLECTNLRVVELQSVSYKT